MQMMNKIDLQEKCKQILEAAPTSSNDLKMRYLYIRLGSILAKNVEFFYEADDDRRKEIYDNYQDINENMEVICRNAVHLYANMARKLGLDCEPLEMGQDEEVRVKHWGLVYNGDNNKRYLMNPIPDFYRVQLGFSTDCFCCYDEYFGYDGPNFDVMPKEYVESLDEQLGYTKEANGVKYTDDLLEKLRSEMIAKLGNHLVKTSDVYQEYYLEMLKLIEDKTMLVEQKLEKIRKFDPDFEDHKELIKRNIDQQYIDKEMKKRIYTLSLRSITDKIELEKTRDGAKYVGTLDRINLGKLKNEKMLYKYNFFLECMPQLTRNLTGFIENKNYIEEVKKYIFQRGERDKIHRHTIYHEENGQREYYMMFSLTLSQEQVYSFYNPQTKECVRNIEPLTYMEQHHLKPLANSSLNEIMRQRTFTNGLLELPEATELFVPKEHKSK